MYVEYSSNNSGGNWWLKDEDWRALEAAGWEVDWIANKKSWVLGPPEPDGRWLGALARAATRRGLMLREAVEELQGSQARTLAVRAAGIHTILRNTMIYRKSNILMFTRRSRSMSNENEYVRSGPDVRYVAEW
jgi:hypothetical protein